MSEEQPTNPAESRLIVRPSTGLTSLPKGSSSAMPEMISRSLAHIQPCGTIATPIRRAGEEREFEIAPGVIIVMCWIPPGVFLMGSPEDEPFRDDSETQHQVTLTQGFWLGKFQVTQLQWQAVMGNNPSYFKGPNLPVETVSRDDVSGTVGFLEMVNRYAGLGGIFSLPTEAQWEYACRAGTSTALNNGKNLTFAEGACPNLDEVAWHRENSGHKTHPVGQKKANAWGLHDMHGNVWEWCEDWYGNYQNEPQVDSKGPDSDSYRVLRGGSWGGYAYYCRSAYRFYDYPSYRISTDGFRIARNSVP